MSFDSTVAGTSEAIWMQRRPWVDASDVDLSAVSHLIVLSAHPDDETLGAAGIMHRASSLGIDIAVIVMTDGEQSHPDSPDHEPAELALVRRRELRAAIGVIAPAAQIRFFGLPDGELLDNIEQVEGLLDATITTLPERGLLMLTPWRGDGHRDHRVLGEAAARVAHNRGVRCLGYPVWMWHWSTPDDESIPWVDLVAIDLTAEERMVKAEAIGRYRSQIHGLSDLEGNDPVLRADFLRHFLRPLEVYFEMEPEHTTSLDSTFFDEFYDGKEDPWGFETRWYESRKRAITLASLPRERYRNGLEVGCATGVLTADLAERCDDLLGIDIAEAPLSRARTRLAGRSHVRFANRATPGEWPEGVFDLVVLSEVGYYWDAGDLATAINRIKSSLAADGTLLLCHWRRPVSEYPLTGDQVHSAVDRDPAFEATVRHVEADFLLTVYLRPPARSVAEVEGLA